MARHRLHPHENLPAHAELPSLAVLEPLIERQEAAGGHWYWLGDFAVTREAAFSWVLSDGTRTRLRVARLLLQLHGDFPRGAGVLNECGLISCVNPSHWAIETRQQRGAAQRPVVLTDFHGKGWTNATRVEACGICFQPPDRPCDPAYHDAEFRRRTAAEATTCPICNAAPFQDCDASVHKAVFQHRLALREDLRVNIRDAAGVVHASTPAPEAGWFFKACVNSATIFATARKHLVALPVTCLACLGE
jgi:hypothetical protein